MQKTTEILHNNENVRNIGEGEPHTTYRRLKLGGVHLYGCSNV
jgi:hypothetical protein